MNIDYKYFMATKDPFDILNKFRLRGYGICLNEKELNIMNTYSAKSAWYWKYFNTYSNKSTEYFDIENNFYKQKIITYYKCKTNNDDINLINDTNNILNYGNLKIHK